MPKQIFFHIGMPKTGSTAMQVFLAMNREYLLQHGYDYPLIGDYELNLAGKVAAGNGADIGRYFRQTEPDEEEKLDFEIAEPVQEFLSVTRSSPMQKILISSEHFGLRSPNWWQAFRDYLADDDLQISLIYFVRRQDQILQSAYAQSMSGRRRTWTMEEFVTDRANHYYWYQKTKALCDILGEDRVLPRVYETAKTSPNGVFGDLFTVLGVPFTDDVAVPDRVFNPSLSPKGLRFILDINKANPRSDFPMAKLKNQILALIDQQSEREQRNLLSRELYAEIIDRYQEDNRKFITSYTNLPPETYDFPEFEAYNELDEQTYDLRELSALIAQLYVHLENRNFNLSQQYQNLNKKLLQQQDHLQAMQEKFRRQQTQIQTLHNKINQIQSSSTEKTIYLHIGIHKTGTTTIQYCMLHNRDWLAQQGYLYPKSCFRYHGHHYLVRHLRAPHLIQEPQNTLDAICAEITLSPHPNVIISTEGLSLLPKENIRILKEQLPGNVSVIVYLRRQDLWLQSFWAQQIKNGRDPGDFESWVDERDVRLVVDSRLRYHDLLDQWETIFGREAIQVGIFDDRFAGDNLVEDFLRRCNLNEFDGLRFTGPRNTTPSHTTLEIIRQEINKQGDFTVKQKQSYAQEIRKLAIKNDWNTQSLNLITESLHQHIMEHYANQNQRVAQRYFNREELFEEPFVPTPLSSVSFPDGYEELVGAVTLDPIQPEERQEESNEVAIIPNTSIPYPPEGLASPAMMRWLGETSGLDVLDQMGEYAAFYPDMNVLDVGSGVGRFGIMMSQFLNEKGSYTGFDVDEKRIAWCQQEITSRHPNIRFDYYDLHNGMYGRGGSSDSSEFVFPYADNSFDFVYLFSVFTHMLPKDVSNYLKQIHRVLRPNGKVWITYFIMNDEAKAYCKSDAAAPIDKHAVPGDNNMFYYSNWTNQMEGKIYYPPDWIEEQYALAQLNIDQIIYGQWCRTVDYINFTQDVIVASKIEY